VKLKVEKRDGKMARFNREKITKAIRKAYDDVYKDTYEYGIRKFAEDSLLFEPMIDKDLELLTEGKVKIEHIQDIIVKNIEQVNKEVADSYEAYRKTRTFNRERNSKTFNDIDDIFTMKSEEVRNNANKAGDRIQTYRAMISDVACSNYADAKIIPPHILSEHGKSIYIHDKSYLPIPMFNCILVNWMDMLEKGFHMGSTYISSPNSITTAIALLSQIISHTTSNTYGGNTLGDLDIGLEPYMEKSYNKHLKIAKKWVSEEEQEEYAWERLETEVYDAVQGLEYEITTLMNSRGEQPFETITFGRSKSKYGRLFQKAYLETRCKGFTDGTTPVFPKICFFLERGVNLEPNDPNYDIFKLAIKCSSVRMYPDYLNVEKLIENTGDVKSPMSCRSFLGTYRDKDGNIITHSRFNQGVCSINLPRLAIESNHDEKKFYELLDEALELTRQVLMIRHNILRTVKAKQSPILYMDGGVARLNAEDSIEPLLLDGFSSISIGYVGLHNCMIALYGNSYYENEQLMKKGKAILQYLKDYCDEQKRKTTIGFSLYSTPAEVLATKFCRQDTKDFGVIEGVNDLGYYENSFHYPSVQDVTAFDKIDFESDFPKIASGGAINYVQFGNMENNLEALEEVIRYAYDKVHYFGVNTRPDRCLACGYKGLIESTDVSTNDYKCPQCGNTDKLKMNIVIRLCGYLGSLSERPTVDGKMKEMNTRVVHCGEI
jgi:ribonucleoside-triphosphate reductase